MLRDFAFGDGIRNRAQPGQGEARMAGVANHQSRHQHRPSR
jgi:hypothetical protein